MRASASSSSSTRSPTSGARWPAACSPNVSDGASSCLSPWPSSRWDSSGMATVPTWGLFLALAIPFGLGSGAIDGGMNGLVLDLYPDGRGRALNLLHLFFSLGALASPLVDRAPGRSGCGLADDHHRDRTRGDPDRDPVRRRGDAVGAPRAIGRDGHRPRRALTADHRAGHRDRLLRGVRGRRLELARALPRDGVDRPGDLGAGVVLGLPRARTDRDRVARRSVRPCAVRGHGGARRGESPLSRPRSCHRCRRRSSCSVSSASRSDRSTR